MFELLWWSCSSTWHIKSCRISKQRSLKVKPSTSHLKGVLDKRERFIDILMLVRRCCGEGCGWYLLNRDLGLPRHLGSRGDNKQFCLQFLPAWLIDSSEIRAAIDYSTSPLAVLHFSQNCFRSLIRAWPQQSEQRQRACPSLYLWVLDVWLASQ